MSPRPAAVVGMGAVVAGGADAEPPPPHAVSKTAKASAAKMGLLYIIVCENGNESIANENDYNLQLPFSQALMPLGEVASVRYAKLTD